jgi:hypothetical protein
MSLQFNYGNDLKMSAMAFAEMRLAIALAFGINTDLYNLYMGREDVEKLKERAIYKLMVMGDCNFIMTPEEMKPCLPELDIVIKNSSQEHIRERVAWFKEGMEEAIKANRPLMVV